MNLIGNSCLASYITRDFLKQKYQNPFCWCIMDFDSCYNLVKFWDVINFENFELIKDKNWIFSVLIDNKVKVQYVHYIFDKNATTVIKRPPDVRYNKIWEYILEKYQERIKDIRKENPTFLFATANYGLERHKPFTIVQQKLIEELNSPYKIIISFKDNIQSDKLICINQNNKFIDNGPVLSKFIYEKMSSI